jgi:cytochrome c
MNKPISFLFCLIAVSGPALVHAADPKPAPGGRGLQFFESKCAMCHMAGKDQAHTVGPNLYGVFGRAVGKAANFQYSPALAGAKDVWDAASLDQFLKAPATARPGTSMPFSGIKNDTDRAAVISYLKNQ